ncbi:hypothetical protein ASPZODRAFT_19518 [Penicilliopsis zonata CBS 506.65]|uniref:2-dehydropantoate 2-reductase n=1 Tax=Penicilliopsis zonata CBS 506.65 TaxID=1073090 RepID=A0A1L9S8E9_9EURO|nr:hypothetical protein ASPZODRAFT_19518 [Penicilliopsis zonata CBS 506.65]OJJ43427.1 hypothetical protein ASPZODRAFT_19518 [Penicilliopsis zonata CBS 506.65]
MQDVDEISKEANGSRLSGRIHILGMGNLGTFVAHSLASRQSPPPTTLMLHHPQIYSAWLSKKRCLAVNVNGLDDIKTGFDVNVLDENKWYSISYQQSKNEPVDTESPRRRLAESKIEGQDLLSQAMEDNEKIECLIVAVKAPRTVAALNKVRHRLTPDSTVLLLQNGMGTIQELNDRVFTDPQTRPHYMFGIVSHGLKRKEYFQVEHSGIGTTIISPIPPHNDLSTTNPLGDGWAPTTKYLLRTLTLTPPLVAIAETPSSLILYQLEKLAMNSVINPLTSIFDCDNGELLYNTSIDRLMRMLLMEISSVICALPELQGIPGIEDRFHPERLRRMVLQLASKTSGNTSSMRRDVSVGTPTEIEYINGYIIRRGEELGIKCAVNYMVKHMVISRQTLNNKRESKAIPIDVLGE